MKKYSLLLILLLSAVSVEAQKEKLKGSRNVTISPVEVGNFTAIELDDKIEVFLTHGDRCEVSIEADDNIHEAVLVTESSGTLRLGVAKEVSSYKKLAVQVTYTSDLMLITATDESRLTALTDMRLDNFTFKISGSSRIYATVRATTFTLMGNDKAKAELNVTAENITTELSKNATAKTLFSAKKMTLDMYQKSYASIEGDVIDLKLRMDGNTELIGKNLTVTNAEIVCEGSANAGIAASGNVIIEASGKSDMVLYGDQAKIEIRKFADNSAIRKKPLK